MSAQPAWLNDLRAQGAQSFSATGYPTRRWEQWKYTDLRPLGKTQFLPAELSAFQPHTGKSLRFVNGVLATMPPSSPGLNVQSLSQALQDDPEGLRTLLAAAYTGFERSPLLALNAAHLGTGAVIHVREGMQGLQLDFQTTQPVMTNVLLLVIVEPGARLKLVESHQGQGGYFTNSVNILDLGQGSGLVHHRVQEEAEEASHLALTLLTLASQADYSGFALNLGAGLSRHEIEAHLMGPDARFSQNGIFLVQNSQLCDTTITVNHTQPRCVSEQNYRGVIDDQGRAVSQQKIHVSRAAQRTDGRQTAHALLLSKTAEFDAKPELEIYADDVKCSHGATAGHLDETALFYLRSRGIPEREARVLLLEGFLNEILDRVDDEALRVDASQKVMSWLRRRF